MILHLLKKLEHGVAYLGGVEVVSKTDNETDSKISSID